MTPEDKETWERALLRFRLEKDGFIGRDPRSPLTQADKEAFRGLRYFDPNPSLRFEVKLQRNPNPESVIMTTSKGSRQLFNRIGYFEITLGNQVIHLGAFQSAERNDPSIFVPFRDATSGTESYGAARYLDLEVEHDDRYVVDFNYAYNPYCAYSEDYVCPLPPHENWLRVPVNAGEKKYNE